MKAKKSICIPKALTMVIQSAEIFTLNHHRTTSYEALQGQIESGKEESPGNYSYNEIHSVIKLTSPVFTIFPFPFNLICTSDLPTANLTKHGIRASTILPYNTDTIPKTSNSKIIAYTVMANTPCGGKLTSLEHRFISSWLTLGQLDKFSLHLCLSVLLQSCSCLLKPQFGVAQLLAAFIAQTAFSESKLVLARIQAHTTVALLETPAKQ